MVEGQSGLLGISDPEENLQFFPSKRLLTWPNGAIATLYGAENYEQLRGPQFDALPDGFAVKLEAFGQGIPSLLVLIEFTFLLHILRRSL